MNKRKLEEYCVKLLELLDAGKCQDLVKGRKLVNDQATAKAASFGPTVRAMGLKPAVMLYSRTDGDAAIQRRAVANAMFQALKLCESNISGDSLLSYVNPLNGAQLSEAKSSILRASVALKLALRTYEEPKKKEEVADQ